MQQLSHPQPSRKIAKGGERMRIFKSGEKECKMTIDKKIGFECLDREEIVRMWNGKKL